VKLTPARLLLLRAYNLSLGRTPRGDRALRALALRLLVRGQSAQTTYCQSARFFSYDDLGAPEDPQAADAADEA